MSGGAHDHLGQLDGIGGGHDDVVDVVLVGPAGDGDGGGGEAGADAGEEYVLVLVEDRPWTDPGVVDHLADRINRCAAYVLEGRFVAEFPEAAGRPVRVDVRYERPRTPDVEALLLRGAEALAQRGIELTAGELA
jgi:hypothetical protein